MAASILFAVRLGSSMATCKLFWSTAITVSTDQGFADIDLVGRCRGLRGQDLMSAVETELMSSVETAQMLLRQDKRLLLR